MEEELRRVTKQCELLAQRLDDLESNRFPSATAASDQKVDRLRNSLQMQITSLENGFRSLEKSRDEQTPCSSHQLVSESQDTVTNPAAIECPSGMEEWRRRRLFPQEQSSFPRQSMLEPQETVSQTDWVIEIPKVMEEWRRRRLFPP